MKKLAILALSVFFLSNSQSVQTNILDGPNNKVIYGERNELHGRDNEVGGYRNNVRGDENKVKGDDNSLVGNQNNVRGHENFVEGKGNFVRGEGNIVLGGDASPADQAMVQAVIQQRMKQIFGQRNLQYSS